MRRRLRPAGLLLVGLPLLVAPAASAYDGGITQTSLADARPGAVSRPFTIRVALELYPGMNERQATNFMIAGFSCFLVGKFIANALIARYSAARVLVAYCGIGAVLLLVAAFGPAGTAIWFVIASNLLMGPCWPTIFGQTLGVFWVGFVLHIRFIHMREFL